MPRSAYQHVSTELKHDLGAKVPLVLFKTQAEFQQQNVIPSEVPEGVAAFAEPTRDRMVLPIDEPPDQLYRLITHELTHIFEFDIIPRGLVQRGIPLWVDEGLSDYMAGVWNPIDLGYSAVYLAYELATKKAEAKPGATLSIGRVGKVTLDDTNSAAMAPPFQFDKTNIEKFSKIY